MPVSLAFTPYDASLNGGSADEAFTESEIATQHGLAGVSELENNSLAWYNNNQGTSSQIPYQYTVAGTTLPASGTYGDSNGTNYTSMYTKIASYTSGQGNADLIRAGILSGPPPTKPSALCIQTGTYGTGNKINTPTDLQQTIVYAIWLGAQVVELPSGYDPALTVAQLQAFIPALVANAHGAGARQVNEAAAVETSTSSSLTASISIPAGDVIVATLMDRGHNQVPTFSDSAGDVYSRAAGATNSSAALDTYWTKAKAPVASLTATVAAADTLILDVQDLNGVSTLASGSSSANGNSTSPNSGTAMTTPAAALVVGFVGWNSTQTIRGQTGTGFTVSVNPERTSSVPNDFANLQSVWGAGTGTTIGYRATLSSSVQWLASVVAFN